MNAAPDCTALIACMEWASGLLPVYPGHRTPSQSVTSNWIRTPARLDYAIHNGVKCFAFSPISAHFVAIDVDVGHADGLDGAATMAARWPGIWYLLGWGIPSTVTPHGGRHIYLRYDGSERYRSESVAPGIEVKHAACLLTAPGSLDCDSGVPYVFDGSLADIPRLCDPPFSDFKSVLRLHSSSPGYVAPLVSVPLRSQKKSSMDDRARFITQWVRKNVIGRENTIYRVRTWAAREGICSAIIRDALADIPELAVFMAENPEETAHALGLK
jgi:hypothetical protein